MIEAEENAFSIAEISEMVNETISDIVGIQYYQNDRANHWTLTIVDEVLTKLILRNPSIKYVVQVVKF